METFLESIKYKILIGKYLGMVFFSTTLNENNRFLNYAYCLPYVVIYSSIVTYSIIKSNFWIDSATFIIALIEFIFFFSVVTSQIALITYFLINRKGFLWLLVVINQYSTTYNISNKNRKVIKFNVFITIVYCFMVFHLIRRVEMNIVYHIAYSIPLSIIAFQQYWILNIELECKLCLAIINTYLLKSLEEEDVLRTFVTLQEQYQNIFNVIKYMNDLFGFPILIYIIVIFITMTASVTTVVFLLKYISFWNYEVLGSILWIFILLMFINFVIECWSTLTKEVSYVLIEKLLLSCMEY